jgi:site-specific DNA-methyltransferase (adenine-specific)
MQIEPNTFICADSIEVLREIQDKTFNLCLTDPPYGIGRDGGRVSTGSHGGRKPYEFRGWDSSIPSAAYFDEMFRVSINQIVWGANYFTRHLPAKTCWLFWDKGQRICNSDGELAFTSFDTALRVVEYNRVELLKDGAVHPTQKPVALFQWCLLNYSKLGDFIIDPFCGSGTTAIACHRTGRRFLCIDKDEEYIKIAQQRYADLIAQQDLFGENQDSALKTAEGRGTACNSASMQVALDI